MKGFIHIDTGMYEDGDNDIYRLPAKSIYNLQQFLINRRER